MAAESPVRRGIEVIEAALATMPAAPGVYRMLNPSGGALYVGKARSLRKRVVAYTQPTRLPERLRRMIAETASLEIITTHTEAEALLLEANLIKRLKPHYNILLRDDKSFPWLMITKDHPFPQVAKHRGAQSRKADYWGPFASAWAVNQTLTAMQRIFLLRSCSDTVFAHRARPCLLYQIRRCSAPCVGRINQEEYAGLVEQAKAFLAGKSDVVRRVLANEMEQASSSLNFEHAASLRDRIRALASLQSSDVINPGRLKDADVIAISQIAGQSCVQVFFIRGGRNYGNRPFFPSHAKHEDAAEILAAFLSQFYEDKVPPPLILLSRPVQDQELIAEALTLKSGRSVKIEVPHRGQKHAVVAHAEVNAREALERKLAEAAGQEQLLSATAQVFGLARPPQRIEVYDNSHIMGTNPYGVMVVAGPEGLIKAAWRKFAIRGPIAPGDDFAMMREVFKRRFSRALAEHADRSDPSWPDLILVDGGAGQRSAAQDVMDELGLADIPLVAIAKGEDRNAGREWFHVANRAPFQLPPRDPVLYFLQRLRDEAHRFAISAHRASRSRALSRSELDAVPGIGAARKRALLRHFGSARGVKEAGLADLATVSGISAEIAKRIYDHFHPGVLREPFPQTGQQG